MESTKRDIIIVGDVHGKFNTLKWNIHDRYKHRDANIIQVGDFGVGFCKPNYYKEELYSLQRDLKEANNQLYVIRGNHDDPSWFKESNHPFGYSNITLLADYSELNLLGKRILLVGGATSVDKVHRLKNNLGYWPDEVFKLNKEFPFKEAYDIVVTHTRPPSCGSFTSTQKVSYWCDEDPELADRLLAEGRLVNQLLAAVKTKEWFYGHFHEHDFREFNGTTFRCLPELEHYAVNI